MLGYRIELAANGRFYLHHKGNAVPVKTLREAHEIAVYWQNAGIKKEEPK